MLAALFLLPCLLPGVFTRRGGLIGEAAQVATVLARMLHSMGMADRSSVMEVNRKDLISGSYQDTDTCIEAIRRARGGVLMINDGEPSPSLPSILKPVAAWQCSVAGGGGGGGGGKRKLRQHVLAAQRTRCWTTSPEIRRARSASTCLRGSAGPAAGWC